MKIHPLLIAVLGGLALVVALFFSQGYHAGEVKPLGEPREATPMRSEITGSTIDRTSPPPLEAPHAASLPAGSAGAHEVAELKARIDKMEQTLDWVVDSLNAIIDRLNRQELQAQRANQPSWGVNQATGEPDTMAAGDRPTAWAPASMDGGPEWLQLGYEKAVEIAQVRVRETCGPGCITKVVAVLDQGAEVVIWQGRQSPGEGIVETPFNAPSGVMARAVKVYLDTKLVPGWNEIDAVEVIGRDGIRQWAQSASASSSYGDRASTGISTRGHLGVERLGISPAGGTLWEFGLAPAVDGRKSNTVPKVPQNRGLREIRSADNVK